LGTCRQRKERSSNEDMVWWCAGGRAVVCLQGAANSAGRRSTRTRGKWLLSQSGGAGWLSCALFSLTGSDGLLGGKVPRIKYLKVKTKVKVKIKSVVQSVCRSPAGPYCTGTTTGCSAARWDWTFPHSFLGPLAATCLTRSCL
jgi:hypothetical protein